jgi:eukaryotic translation initiation factor 2-alpha kinase 4
LYERSASTLAHLKEVTQYAKSFGVVSKVYINPLSCVNEAFYKGGFLFQCIYDRKVRDVFAAGGRYDSLIREHRPKIGGHFQECHAVGFGLAWEKFARAQQQQKTGGKAFLKKSEEEAQGIFGTTRVSAHVPLNPLGQPAYRTPKCDVLVASFDPAILRSTGIEILSMLWNHNISAEIARDARSPEDLLSQHRDENHSWIIIIKQDNMLKVKTMFKKDIPDADLPMAQLMSWMRTEIRERDSRAVVKLRGSTVQSEGNTIGNEKGSEQEVRVMVSQTKSKKFNRRTVLEQAQISAASLVHSFLEGPILAIETADQVLDIIRETKLSDHESWRKLEQGVSNAEKRYVKDIHDMLDTWRSTYERKNGSRHSFLYNFRTGSCIYYDLGA